MTTGEQDIFPYRPPNNTERHIQTVILAIILSSLAWLGSIIVSTHDSQIQVNVQLDEIKRRMLLLEQNSSSYVPRNEYDRDTGVMIRKLDDVDGRIRAIEVHRGR